MESGAKQQPVNHRSWVETFACVVTASGGETVGLSDDEAARFDANPDQWAADYFDLTLEQYYEWIERNGVPLCGGITKTGKRCGAAISGQQPSARAWLEMHRKYLCVAHSHQSARQPPLLRVVKGGQ